MKSDILPIDEYDSKEADYVLRETIFNLKGNIDLLFFGALEDAEEEERLAFLGQLKENADNIYNVLNSNIVAKANKIKQLNSIIQKDLALAKKIQQKLLPKAMSHENGIRIATRYLPLVEVGGDIYDVCDLNETTTRVFLADATGHGVQAALITMLIKSEYEKCKLLQEGPSAILSSLNRVFSETYHKLTVFFTGIIVDINMNAKTITYTAAGHPDEFLVSRDETRLIERNGQIVGVMENASYRETSMVIEPGDTLILFTDGLFEEFNDSAEEYGKERLLASIEAHRMCPLESMLDNILDDVTHFRKNAERNDDITLIGIQCGERS